MRLDIKLTYEIYDVDEAPTIQLSNSTILNGSAAYTPIGQIIFSGSFKVLRLHYHPLTISRNRELIHHVAFYEYQVIFSRNFYLFNSVIQLFQMVVLLIPALVRLLPMMWIVTTQNLNTVLAGLIKNIAALPFEIVELLS
jgi:hypothetical protein